MMENKEHEIKEYYLVSDLQDTSAWGGYETIEEAEKEIRQITEDGKRSPSEFEIIREIVISDVVQRGIKE